MAKSTSSGPGKGFAEGQQAAFHAGPSQQCAKTAGSTSVSQLKLKIGPGGRVVIPADLRAAFGVKEGDVLWGEFDGTELRVVSIPTAVKRAQTAIREFVPDGVSLADELIAERRAEAAREGAGNG